MKNNIVLILREYFLQRESTGRREGRGHDERRFQFMYNFDDVYQYTAHWLLLY